ncbi:hypothetical protein QBC37DRAFT_456178 [Rhypophila decipiens]|uniref:Rhodopsin domain-containing protein n=1 Tax=Rhypophila decipiens TaxID=261697 RepID=A0AAN6XVA2_9PEZI|nr:hypothetical protein QBC37DRAFT_456178 [Rhypophila decipiens]
MIDPRGLQLFIADIVFLVLTWVFFSLRALVTLILIRRVSADDILMFVSILIYTAHNTISVWGIVFASEVGQTNPLKGESIALTSWFICEVLYAPLSALIRTSIALFLLRIATVKWHRYTIYGTLGIVWALSIPFFFILVFQCNPPEHFYDQVLDDEHGGTCLDHHIVPHATIAHSVISALMDFVLALLPIAILWNVKLSKRTKAGVAALLGMGLFAGVALVARIPFIEFTPVSSREFLGQSNDVALWSILETSFGIIAGCAATLRPLASSLPSSRRSKYRSSGRSGGYSHSRGGGNSRQSMPTGSKRHTIGGSQISGGGNGYWPKSETRTARVTSRPATLSTVATSSNSRLRDTFYEEDSNPDLSRERISRAYFPGYGYNSANTLPSTAEKPNGVRTARNSKDGRGNNRQRFSAGKPPLLPARGVHVQTSISVTREDPGDISARTDSCLGGERLFGLQGDRVVTINGPMSQGLSVHTY